MTSLRDRAAELFTKQNEKKLDSFRYGWFTKKDKNFIGRFTDGTKEKVKRIATLAANTADTGRGLILTPRVTIKRKAKGYRTLLKVR